MDVDVEMDESDSDDETLEFSIEVVDTDSESISLESGSVSEENQPVPLADNKNEDQTDVINKEKKDCNANDEVKSEHSETGQPLEAGTGIKNADDDNNGADAPTITQQQPKQIDPAKQNIEDDTNSQSEQHIDQLSDGIYTGDATTLNQQEGNKTEIELLKEEYSKPDDSRLQAQENPEVILIDDQQVTPEKSNEESKEKIDEIEPEGITINEQQIGHISSLNSITESNSHDEVPKDPPNECLHGPKTQVEFLVKLSDSSNQEVDETEINQLSGEIDIGLISNQEKNHNVEATDNDVGQTQVIMENQPCIDKSTTENDVTHEQLQSEPTIVENALDKSEDIGNKKEINDASDLSQINNDDVTTISQSVEESPGEIEVDETPADELIGSTAIDPLPSNESSSDIDVVDQMINNEQPHELPDVIDKSKITTEPVTTSVNVDELETDSKPEVIDPPKSDALNLSSQLQSNDVQDQQVSLIEEGLDRLKIPEITEHNLEATADSVAADDSGDGRDETTPIPLGSPDIQINDEDKESSLQNIMDDDGIDDNKGDLIITPTDDSSDQLGDNDDAINCCTPTGIKESLLDPNCLYNFLSPLGGNQDADSEDDLEAEFDNEPEFVARDVHLKRGMEPRDCYEFGDELGRGRFGTVFRVRDKLSGLELAAKMILIRRQADLSDVEREIAIMSILQHPRLLQLYDAFVDCPSSNGANQLCLVTELIEGGELFERIVDDDFDLTEKKAAIFMRQICEGVEYMHKMGVVHLDLKPENILCVSKTSNRIKLIDFGLARKLTPGESLRVMFGTPDFAAPEVLSYDIVTCATDMWSVGVICYVLLSGLSPFMGDTDVETMANVQRATYDFDSDAFDPITELAKDFISRLLVREPKSRLKPRDCLEHAWLQKGGRLLEAAVRSRRESMVSVLSIKSDNFDLSQYNGPSGIASMTSLNKRNLKKYVVRRKWHRTVNAIMALRRMGANLKQKLTGQT